MFYNKFVMLSFTPPSQVNISEEDTENTFGSTIEGIFIIVTPFFY